MDNLINTLDQDVLAKILLALWVFPWKIAAIRLMYKDKKWLIFALLVALLPVNTFAILEVIVVFLVHKKVPKYYS